VKLYSYLLSSPSSGIVHFSNILQEKQQVKSGTEIIFLTQKENQFIGKIRIPQTNFGKIAKNQRVIVKFQGYPFEEYGAVEGMVAKISAIPIADNQFFMATVNLPLGLTTNYGKKLTYTNNMMASSEIITEDLRLIERLFYQFRRLIN
jgi:HlyD family secretion protein